MSTSRLAVAIDALVRQFLSQNPGSLPFIAEVAEQIARLARESMGTDPVPPPPAPGPPVDPPADVAAGSDPASQVTAPATAAAPAPVPAHAGDHTTPGRLSSGLVPLKLADNGVTHVRVEGTGADLAAARVSAAEPQSSGEAQADLRRFHPPDLQLIAERCMLKARACRAAIERRAASAADEPEQVRTIDALLSEGEQIENCSLWMVNRAKPQPDDATLSMIASAYENLASAARVCERVPSESHPDRRSRALALLAEAQSALRESLKNTWLKVADRDQDDAFRYLIESTRYEHVFIKRFMRLSDQADPSAWSDLRDRLAAFLRKLAGDDESRRKTKALVSKIRHHARHLLANPGQDADHDWRRIDEALHALAKAGRPRDPDALGWLKAVASVAPAPGRYAAVDRALAPGPDAGRADPAEPEKERYSRDVARVRSMLRGGRLVIIGGERREDAERRIREAFELVDVDWVVLTEHGSAAPAEAPIRRRETRVVLVLIRLVGHLHAEEIAQFCARHDKPLVRLPAGYNPERIAAEIIEQVSHRLAQPGPR